MVYTSKFFFSSRTKICTQNFYNQLNSDGCFFRTLRKSLNISIISTPKGIMKTIEYCPHCIVCRESQRLYISFIISRHLIYCTNPTAGCLWNSIKWSIPRVFYAIKFLCAFFSKKNLSSNCVQYSTTGSYKLLEKLSFLWQPFWGTKARNDLKQSKQA